MENFINKLKGCPSAIKNSAKNLLDFIIKNPICIYILLFLKPIADMFYSVALFDYFTLLYAIVFFAYMVYKNPGIIKRLKLIDYITFLTLFLLLLAFFRNTSGLRIFIKTASQFLLFFIGKYLDCDDEKCIKALRISSYIAIFVNFIIFIIGFIYKTAVNIPDEVITDGVLGFIKWGNAITFKGTYYFKTDLAIGMIQALIFVLFAKRLKWYDYLFAFFSLIMIFMSNARIAFILAFVIIGIVILQKIEGKVRFFKKPIRLFDIRLAATVIGFAAFSFILLSALSKSALYGKLGFIAVNLDDNTSQSQQSSNQGGNGGISLSGSHNYFIISPNTIVSSKINEMIQKDVIIDSSDAAKEIIDISGDISYYEKINIKRSLGYKIKALAEKLYSGENTQGRSVIWSMLWEDFQSRGILNKLIGIDFVSDNYEIMHDYYATSHNTYLKTLYSTGYIGLLLFVCFLVLIIINIQKKGIDRTTFFINIELICVLLAVGISTPACETTQFTWVTMFFIGRLFWHSENDIIPEEEQKGVKESVIITNVRKAISTKYYVFALFILAILITLFKIQVAGVLAFAFILCFVLIVCDDITVTTPPFLFLCVFACMCYDSFYTFISYWWLAFPAAFAILYHFIKYRKPIVIGRTFYGIVTVSVALLLGGAGYISAKEYFNPIALYYTLGLGIGMIIVYLLIKSQIGETVSEEIKDRLLLSVYLAGLIACFCTLTQYFDHLELFVNTFSVLSTLISRNNFATFIMLALPVATYYSTKNPYHIVSIAALYLSLIMTGSRGGLLFGTIEMVFMYIYLMVFSKNKAVRISVSVISAVIIVFGLVFLKEFMAFFDVRYEGYFITTQDVRYAFLKRLGEIFSSNPVFGQGLGIQEHTDIYIPKTGGLTWYHMMTPQIIGSLGIAGIIGYGIEIILRGYTSITRACHKSLAFSLSYLGLFMMSQVNPGEFCPLPYELLAVYFYIIIESYPPNKLGIKADEKIGKLFSKLAFWKKENKEAEVQN